MDIPLTKPSEGGVNSNRTKKTLVAFLHGLAFGLIVKWVTEFLAAYNGPAWLKLGLILTPWLVLAASWRFLKKAWQEDELEKIISRDALAFACYGLIAGLILLGQLQAAGFVGKFKWDNGHIVLVMIFLVGGGIFWSGRRFR